VKLKVIGSGDAFCTGGRMQACFVLEAGGTPLMIDCGATSLAGLELRGIHLADIPRIVISHLHGDHFGGLIWCLMHQALVVRRTTPLDLYGPPGLEARVIAAMEVLYPGMNSKLTALHVRYHVMHARHPLDIGGIRTTAFEVDHPSGAPSYGLRFESHGKVFAYSGDSQWTDALIDIGRAADLYLIECYKYAGVPVMHLSFEQITQNLDRIGAKRLLLTHMSRDMLEHRAAVKNPKFAFADDGGEYHV
jgi:ribonuclease BN (tRNA processing enzyme)